MALITRRQYVIRMFMAGTAIAARWSVITLPSLIQPESRRDSERVDRPVLATRMLPRPVTFRKMAVSLPTLELRSLYSPAVPLKHFLTQTTYRRWSQHDLLVGVLDGRLDRRILAPGWLREQLRSGFGSETGFAISKKVVFSHDLNCSFAPRDGFGVNYRDTGDALDVAFVPPLCALDSEVRVFPTALPRPTINTLVITDSQVTVHCTGLPYENVKTTLRVSLSMARERLSSETVATQDL